MARRVSANPFLLVVWVIITLLPWKFAPEKALDTLIWILGNFSEEARLRVFLFAILSSIQEALFINLLFLILAYVLPRFLSWFGILIGWVAVTAYFFLIALSWYFFMTRGTLLTYEEVPLLFLAQDYRFILDTISDRDLGLAVLAFLMSALLAFIFFWRSEARNPFSALAQRIVQIVIVVGIQFFLVFNLPVSSSQQKNVPIILHKLLTPQTSLVAALITPHEESFSATEFPQRAPDRPSEYLAKLASLQKPSKNILLLIIEGLRVDALKAFGARTEIMPTLNRLAEEGLLFTRAYANGTETAYSMISLFTGIHPLKYHIRDNFVDLDYPFIRITDVLDAAGYEIGIFTYDWISARSLFVSDSISLYSDPSAKDSLVLDRNLAPLQSAFPSLSGTPQAGEVDKINIERFKIWREKSAHQQRWMASFYLFTSHFPYVLPAGEKEILPPGTFPFDVSFFKWPKEFSVSMKNRYFNTLRAVDDSIGELLQFLQSKKSLEDTIIIVTGDHGEMFHEHDEVGHGGRLYEEVVHVPLILAHGGHKGVSSKVVSHLDVAPSITDLLNLPSPNLFQGESFIPQEEVALPHNHVRPVYFTSQTLVNEDGILAWPFKYTRSYRGEPARLYNIEQDPREQNNLVDTRSDLTFVLDEALSNFRNRQLSYFASPAAVRNNSAPPPIEPVKIIP